MWIFALATEDGRTRLISRNRIATPAASPPARVFNMLVMEPGSLIMERKMLLGIKRRAERLAREGLTMSRIVVNAKTCEISRPDESLLEFLRSELGLTGVKEGCGEGECGACTVLLDGQPALACQLRTGQLSTGQLPTGLAAGCSVTTIEGLADSAGEPLHPVQRALVAERASQCGYCTPGIALRAAALLAAHPDPGDGQIAAALDPCLCRCGCYPGIVRAVHRAAALARGADESQTGPARAGTDPLTSVTRPALARPARPWDLSAPEDRDWFGVLGHGLVVVWPPDGAGSWPRVGGRVAARRGVRDGDRLHRQGRRRAGQPDGPEAAGGGGTGG